jgi:hypothetical protein
MGCGAAKIGNLSMFCPPHKIKITSVTSAINKKEKCNYCFIFFAKKSVKIGQNRKSKLL